MHYVSRYDRFQAPGPEGAPVAVEFRKAGFLAAGDEPELYFFQAGAREVIVGVSGETLRWFQRERRYLSREEKIDIAGLRLKQRMESGALLDAETLHIRGAELEHLARLLGLAV